MTAKKAQASTFNLTFERDWLFAPVAWWVHIPQGDGIWTPPAPRAIPHKGFAVLNVALGTHTLRFSSPAQLAHVIDVLATTPLPTSRQLSVKRGASVGPNGHWLSRLPSELKSTRRRAEVVLALRAAQRAAVDAVDRQAFVVPVTLGQPG
jgi:hypothetical protein